MKSSEDLRRMLRAVDHKSYPAYKDLRGAYSFGSFVLGIDHVQGDPLLLPPGSASRLTARRRPFRLPIIRKNTAASPCRTT